MILLLLAQALGTAPNVAVVEKDGIRIETSVRSSRYDFVVTNLGREPIMRVEIPYQNGHNFTMPNGWSYQAATGDFVAWTTERAHAIRLGQSGDFGYNVATKGAVLGYIDVRVEFVSGAGVTLERVWGAVPQPTSQVLVVALSVLAIFAVHALLMRRTDRRAPR